MKTLTKLFKNNENWLTKIETDCPGFFKRLSEIHDPDYLWIGCSDSRVPANEIVGLLPGELFVHRNIANQVIHTDINCLSVIQYAIDVLKVKHVIVCGHYDCGGVKAAFDMSYHGLIDNWLRNLQEVIRSKRQDLEKLETRAEKLSLICELNVQRQALNVGETTIVQEAWRRGQELHIHGWMYSLKNGRLKDMGISLSSLADLEEFESHCFG